ncbi:MAG TPA: hypothetical protein VGF29_15335 [Hyphomicrobiaceae bacterium]|jgi:hypothetical protein
MANTDTSTDDYMEPLTASILKAALLVLDRIVATSESDAAHEAREALESYCEEVPDALPWPADRTPREPSPSEGGTPYLPPAGRRGY